MLGLGSHPVHSFSRRNGRIRGRTISARRPQSGQPGGQSAAAWSSRKSSCSCITSHGSAAATYRNSACSAIDCCHVAAASASRYTASGLVALGHLPVQFEQFRHRAFEPQILFRDDVVDALAVFLGAHTFEQHLEHAVRILALRAAELADVVNPLDRALVGAADSLVFEDLRSLVSRGLELSRILRVGFEPFVVHLPADAGGFRRSGHARAPRERAEKSLLTRNPAAFLFREHRANRGVGARKLALQVCHPRGKLNRTWCNRWKRRGWIRDGAARRLRRWRPALFYRRLPAWGCVGLHAPARVSLLFTSPRRASMYVRS